MRRALLSYCYPLRLEHRRPLRKTSDCRSPLSADRPHVPTEDLFVYVYVPFTPCSPAPWWFRLAVGLQRCRAAGHHGGPAPAGRAARPGSSPRWRGTGHRPGVAAPERGQPADPLAVGRVRAAQGGPGARLPEDDCQQVDTSALPVKHPSRVRPDHGPGPATTWPPGRPRRRPRRVVLRLRLAIRTDLGSRIGAHGASARRRERARGRRGPADRPGPA